MHWFPIALLCAFLTACCDAFAKRLSAETDEWFTGAVVLGICSVVLSPVFFLYDLNPFTAELGIILAIGLPFEIGAYYLFLSAVKMSPLSLTIPLLAFSPVFTVITAFFIVDERASAMGAAGIGLVTLGAYLLHSDLIGRDLLLPIKALFSDPGCRRMLMVACIWSFTSALGKRGINLYGALPFGILLFSCIALVFACVSAVRVKTGRTRLTLQRRTIVDLLLGGLFMAGMSATYFVAMGLAPVSYMISVKRLSLVFSVIIGWRFFGEDKIRYRLVGASVMVAGVALIYLS
jgi:drug/metabolite transporter (DMT)-like permease